MDELLRDHLRQRAPRRLRHRRGGHRRATRSARAKVARFIGAPLAARDRVHQERHRGASTWSPTRGAAPTCAPATSSCSPRWSTTPTSCPWLMLAGGARHRAALHPARRRRHARPRRPRPAARRGQAARRHGHVERARHAHAGRASSPTPPTPPARSCMVDGAPVRAPPAHRRHGARVRLLRLHRPQDARPDRHRRAVGPRGAARRHAAVPRRRRDDPRRPPRRLDAATSIPWKFEAGTPPIAEAIGLGAAVDYLEALGHGRRARTTRSRSPATPSRTLAERFGDDLTHPRPADPTQRGGVLSFAFQRRAPPRHLPGARRARRVRAGRPPLRQAADAAARRRGHGPGIVLRLQRRGRHRRPRRRARRRRRVLRV